jgi:hypothetical protein
MLQGTYSFAVYLTTMGIVRTKYSRAVDLGSRRHTPEYHDLRLGKTGLIRSRPGKSCVADSTIIYPALTSAALERVI